jgi:hypothetical protein
MCDMNTLPQAEQGTAAAAKGVFLLTIFGTVFGKQ